MADEGLRFEAYSMPHVGSLTRKFDFSKWVESYTLNDRFNDLTDGVLTLPDDFPLAASLFHVDEANHANDVGSMIRVLRGTTPILHYLVTRSEDSWSDQEPTHKLALEGLEWLLDRALVPNYDHPADPTVDPDWIYGADTVLKNAGLEESGESKEIQLVWLTGATGGTFTITFSAQTTSAIAWNADWFAVGTALEALSNIQDVTVSGAGTGTSPWTIEFLDPDGDVAAVTLNIGSLTGPAPLGHVETTLPGGQSDTAGWTTSFNPSTGEPHGTYDNFQVSTAQAHSGTHSLLINASAPANPFDFPGAQQILNVTPGRTYRAEVWIRPTFSSTFKLVIRTMDETWIAESTGSGTPLTANVWTKLTVDPFVIPEWIDQIIFRVGLIDSTDQGDWYLDDAVLAPGFPAAPLGKMASDVFTAAQALGVLLWLTPTWTTTLDSDGNAWDQDRQWNVNHGQTFLQLFEYCRRWNYEFRIRWDAGDSRFEWDMWNPLAGGQARANIAVTGKSGVMGSAPIVQRPPNATYVKAEGELGRWGEFASTTLDDTWGRLEKFHQDRQGVNSAELDVLAERIITKTTENTAARAVTVSDPSLLPWQAYEPGDTVTLNLAPKDVKRVLRVAAIVVSKGPNDAAPKYDVHFGAPVYSNDTAIASGLRTLIREFRRPQFTSPAAKPLPEIPPPVGGGSAPTLVLAALNSPDSSKERADLIGSGTAGVATDHLMFRDAIARMSTGGGGRILVTEGDFYFGSSVVPVGSIRVEGMGMGSTHIHMGTAANTDMFHLPSPFSDTFELVGLDLDGVKATQTAGSPSAILFDPNAGTGRLTMHQVRVRDFRGNGLTLDRPACKFVMTSCLVETCTLVGVYLFVEGDFMIANSVINGNGTIGIQANGAALELIGSVVKDNGTHGFSAGGINESTQKILVGNAFTGNGSTGILWDGVNGSVDGNYVAANGQYGMNLFGNEPLVVTGNVIRANTLSGVLLEGGAGNQGGVFANNVVKSNLQHGIFVAGSHWAVTGNRVEQNGTQTTNTYDGIHLNASADDCEILNNKIREAAGGNAMRYAINVSAAGATNNWVVGNRASGAFGTGNYNDAGTGTINVWAGTFGDNY